MNSLLRFETSRRQDSSSATPAKTSTLKAQLADPANEWLDHRIDDLAASADRAGATTNANFQRGQQLRDDLASAATLVRHWEAQQQQRPNDSVVAESLSTARRDEEKHKKAYADYEAYSKDDLRRANQIRRTSGVAIDYLHQLSRAGIPFTYVAPPKHKGDADEIVADSYAEERDTLKRPAPQKEVIAALIAKGDAAATEAKLRISYGKAPDLMVPVEPVLAEPSSLLRDAIPVSQRVDPWLWRFHRAELIEDIKQQVAEHYRDLPEGMSEADKRKKLAELAEQRLAADRVRCARIWDDFESGRTSELVFPPDADPRAVLSLAGPEPVRRD